MITTNEVPAIPKKAINEITFLLYNYNDLEQIIEQNKEDVIDCVKISGKGWLRKEHQNQNSVESQVIRIQDDKSIKRLTLWQEVLNCFIDEYQMNYPQKNYDFIKLKYFAKLTKEELTKKTKLNIKKQRAISNNLIALIYFYAKDYDFQTYNNVTGNIQTENTEAKLNEQTASFYFSLNKNWATGTSFSVSATGEYYTIGNYHKWAVYPQASLTYLKSPKHIFQLSLSTDKTYPGYWDMQSSVTYLNGYSELQGTPGLRPMTNYNLNGTYILKQKYIFGLFYTHTSDYFAQSPYQATDRLALIYKNTNWNYMRMIGANVILPFSIGNWYDARLTLVGMQARQKCDQFFDVPFDRKKWMFVGTLDNTFKVGKNLSLELTGNIQTPFIQGTLDLASSFNLTAGVKWNFAKDKFSLTARCSDIFNSSMPDMKVRFKGQYLDMNSSFYTRTVSLNLTYRFGGYKKQEVKGVDTSRFGH